MWIEGKLIINSEKGRRSVDPWSRTVEKVKKVCRWKGSSEKRCGRHSYMKRQKSRGKGYILSINFILLVSPLHNKSSRKHTPSRTRMVLRPISSECRSSQKLLVGVLFVHVYRLKIILHKSFTKEHRSWNELWFGKVGVEDECLVLIISISLYRTKFKRLPKSHQASFAPSTFLWLQSC